jgi:hypothetical protein
MSSMPEYVGDDYNYRQWDDDEDEKDRLAWWDAMLDAQERLDEE